MDTQRHDVIVIGGGMAGATAAAHLAPHMRVALLEAEDSAGYHSTGRSAAIWIHNYGPADVRALTGASRAFFEAPPAGFSEVALMARRPVVFLAPAAQRAHLDRLLAEGIGLQPISIAELRAMVPVLRSGYAEAAAIERDAFDMDVAALHAGFLRVLRAEGGVVELRHRTGRIERVGGLWRVETAAGDAFAAPTLVNAAGAWGDAVAEAAGVVPLGLRPKRRTALIVDPGVPDSAGWPLLNDVDHTWYVRPEARTRLLVSPADETDSEATDAQPDELDVAIAVDRMTAALDIEVRRVEHAWAGLRTFTPDRSLAIGFGEAPGFVWAVGQGGYGIQTAPAAGRLVADFVLGRAPEPAVMAVLPMLDPRRFARVAA